MIFIGYRKLKFFGVRKRKKEEKKLSETVKEVRAA
jgi:hypothetical protein